MRFLKNFVFELFENTLNTFMDLPGRVQPKLDYIFRKCLPCKCLQVQMFVSTKNTSLYFLPPAKHCVCFYIACHL